MAALSVSWPLTSMDNIVTEPFAIAITAWFGLLNQNRAIFSIDSLMKVARKRATIGRREHTNIGRFANAISTQRSRCPYTGAHMDEPDRGLGEPGMAAYPDEPAPVMRNG